MIISDQKLQKAIQWNPFKQQKEIIKAFNKKETRELVICAGRRFGKSQLMSYLAIRELFSSHKDILILAASYELTGRVIDQIRKWLGTMNSSLQYQSRPFPKIYNPITGSTIEGKSADSPEGILGKSYNLVIVDEAALLDRRIYETYVYPTTSSVLGKTVYISTPRGKNWFYEKWLENNEDGNSFQFSSIESEYFTKEAWEDAQKKLPERVFNQEFKAIFEEGTANVFRGIRDIIDDTLKEPEPGGKYIMGLDLAKIQDFTVMTIVDKNTHNVVFWDRFQIAKYPLQIARIEAAANKYNALVVAETNNIGLVVIDELRARNVKVEDFTSVGTISKDSAKKGTKERLINKLSVDIENKNIHIPQNTILIDELGAYSYKITPSGNFTYSAPVGLHDDCVMSLALANWTLKGRTREKRNEARRKQMFPKRKFQYF